MATEKALRAYACVISFLEEHNWKYKRNDDELTIITGFKTDDYDIDFKIFIDEKRELVCFRSKLPELFPEDKRVLGAYATCIANCGMFDGFFEFDVNDGEVVFKASDSFKESDMSVAVVEYLFNMSYAFVDRYNDRFLKLADGSISLEKFIELEAEN